MPKEITYIRLEPEIKRIVERVAKSDQRSLSAFIAKLVTDWARDWANAQKARTPR